MTKTHEQVLQVGTLINICDQINCPYNDKINGCQRYNISVFCHLAWEAPGKERPGVYTIASQYWLYGSHEMNWIEIKEVQHEFLSTDEEQIRLGQKKKSIISFSFIQFNPRRAMRGAEAAEFEIYEDGQIVDRLWMSKRDIQKNIRAFGESTELKKGLQQYEGNNGR